MLYIYDDITPMRKNYKNLQLNFSKDCILIKTIYIKNKINKRSAMISY